MGEVGALLLQIMAEALFGKAAEAAAGAARSALAGDPLERTLAEELEGALRDSVASCRPAGALGAGEDDVVALLEHVHRADPRLRSFLAPPPSIFAEVSIRAYWERVTDDLLEPLGDPAVTGVGRSWADLNGIDLHRLSRAFVATLWRRLRRRAFGGNVHGLVAELEHQEVLAAVADLKEAVDRLGGQPAGRSAAAAFARYLRAEARLDSRVRLKEVGYAGELFQVFVDPRLDRRRFRVRGRRAFLARNVTVGDVLLGRAGANEDRVVVEAPPGYGKSTLVQYVSQIHRLLHLAGPSASESPLKELIGDQPVRVPVRVQCKQLASWMAEQATDTPVSIDAYLADEITRRGAPGRCAAEDVIELLAKRDALLVIDGHDEIRNDAVRQTANEALLAFIAELDAAASSLQVIVTRRPAIYGSDDQTFEDFTTLALAQLSRAEIGRFARRWLRSKHDPDEDLAALDADAMRKLGHPNVATLATNPLQLTILMQLAEQLADLPHRRTELYDRYVDIFFNREASKSAEVREHRQHLEDLHEFAAWHLMSRTDRGLAAGLTRAELDELLATFLGRAGLSPPLITDLSSGVERVFLLVANGRDDTYDFEVESLKEYFCARYVYQAAGAGKEDDPPPVGRRFTEIASRPRWLNVTRFYAGRYRRGELADIRYCVRQMLRDPTLARLAAPRMAAMQLVADGVFAGGEQASDLTRDLWGDVVDVHGVRHALFDPELWMALGRHAKAGLLIDVAERLVDALAGKPSGEATSAIGAVLTYLAAHAETLERIRRRWLERQAALGPWPGPVFLDAEPVREPVLALFGYVGWLGSEALPAYVARLAVTTAPWAAASAWRPPREPSDEADRLALRLGDVAVRHEAVSTEFRDAVLGNVLELDRAVGRIMGLAPAGTAWWWLAAHIGVKIIEARLHPGETAGAAYIGLPLAAAHRPADAKWWRDRFRQTRDDGERQVLCWLAAYWASPDVFRAVRRDIERALAAMRPDDRRTVWRQYAQFPTRAVPILSRIGVWDADESSPSVAMALAAGGADVRCERSLVGGLLRTALSGDADTAQFLLFQLDREDHEVVDALRSHRDVLIELLRIAGRRAGGTWRYQFPMISWTDAELRELLGDGHQLADDDYRAAERMLASRWLAAHPPLSDVAERDHWFTLPRHAPADLSP